jgi:hypothetical protein
MQSSHKLREDIQALRAIAILAVLIYHLSPNILPGGFMGVDVFFVISGYLMTLTIWKGIGQLKRLENSLKNGIKEATNFLLIFYTRRISFSASTSAQNNTKLIEIHALKCAHALDTCVSLSFLLFVSFWAAIQERPLINTTTQIHKNVKDKKSQPLIT